MTMFVSAARQAEIVDARCVCGHPHRYHGRRFVGRLPDGTWYTVPEDGNCCAPGVDCPCRQFAQDPANPWFTRVEMLAFLASVYGPDFKAG